jgi:hypothetical protein
MRLCTYQWGGACDDRDAFCYMFDEGGCLTKTSSKEDDRECCDKDRDGTPRSYLLLLLLL